MWGICEKPLKRADEVKVFVAYYRVSTDRQGASGLGLEAQRRAVADFAAGRGRILAEFTEVIGHTGALAPP